MTSLGTPALISVRGVCYGTSASPTTPCTTESAGTVIAQALVVAGGGGGGGYMGGGGGAGGLIYNDAVALSVQSYAVTVGAGGAGGANSAKGTNGANSSFSGLTAVGGGGGSYWTGGVTPGNAGGSGGGGAGSQTGYTSTGGLGTSGQGNDGGAGNSTTNYKAGGGGGAATVGQAGQSSAGGAGGAGGAYSISGSAVYYAGGGGGGGYSSCTGGAGGSGGGGTGSCASGGNGTAGTANTGGGGGGAGYPSSVLGGTGGSGIVIISYPTNGGITATGGTITTSGGRTIHTFTSSGTFTVSSQNMTTGTFTHNITGLSQTTTYYYRGYATNATGTAYSSDGTFTTLTGAVPTLTTPTAASVTTTTATLGATITSLGVPAATSSYGMCWGTSPSPTTCVSGGVSAATGAFTYAMTGLTPGTVYYYRGYATNATGTGYSADGTFTALIIPTVTTPTSASVATTSATLGAEVTSLGVPASISARGTCWGTTASPTSNCTAAAGITTGVFTHSRTGLTPGTLYYYRGYATNSTGTAYSADGTFTTQLLPDVATTAAASITTTTATIGANIISLGVPAVISARGTCYGTAASPATDCLDEGGTTTGVFTRALTGLTAHTLYFYRGYAIHAAGTAYSGDTTLVTATPDVAGTMTASDCTITAGYHSCSADLTWSTTDPVPAIAKILIVAGGGGGGGVMGGGGGAGGLSYVPMFPLDVQSYTVTVGAGGAGGTGSTKGTNGTNSIFSIFTSVGGGGGAYFTGSANPGNAGGSGGGAAAYAAGTGGAGTTGQGYQGGSSAASNYRAGGGGGAGAAGQAGQVSVGGAGGAGSTYSISGSAVTYAGGGGGGGYSGCTGGAGGAGGGGGGFCTDLSTGTSGAANTGGGGGGAGYPTGTGGSGGSGIVIISYPTASAVCTGGTMSTSGSDTIHTFNASGTFTCTSATVISTVTTPTDITLASANSGTSAYTVEYGSRDFSLSHNSVLLSQDTAAATCAAASTWDSFVCAPDDGTPTVVSPTVTSIEKTSAVLGANLSFVGDPDTISARGTCWDTTPNPTANCAAEGGTTRGVFTHSRTGLTPGTDYYYRGYAINANGTIYSEDATFTSAIEPAITTPTSASVGTITAILGANVTDLGHPEPLLARGVCYGTSASPTTPCTTDSPGTMTADVLVVAGGGGGGGAQGGGGGAGGIVYNTATSLSVQSYTVSVGSGGAGGVNTAKGSNGTDSSFNGLTAVGGGGGSYFTSLATPGNAGGSGGGGGGYYGGLAGAGTAGQGHTGGMGSPTSYRAGGGGGASRVGQAAQASVGGAGGTGSSYSISGSAVMYAGGGGGGGYSGCTGGAGGSGGGGAGVCSDSSATGTAGSANTGGGGGGGGGYNSGTGGAGGRGVVIISYPTNGGITATGGTITTSGDRTIHTFTSTGTFTVTSRNILTGTFTHGITGLSEATAYYYRGYATNVTGTTYSDDGTFTTLTGAVPTLTTPTSTAITTTTATVGANITSLGTPAVASAYGVCWGTSPAPTSCVAAGDTTTGVFTYVLAGLTPGTVYYYRGYATNTTGTAYSDDGTFTTLSIPTVTTPTATDIAITSATLGAEVTSLGIPAVISARGTCWGTTANPTTNCTAEGGTTTGVFTHVRTGLSPNTLYYYRGYATNSTGTAYSANGTFTTLMLPAVTATAAASVTTTTATIGANVTSLGNPAVISARGTCYGTTASPVTNCVDQGGTTTGAFTRALSGLTPNTLYFFRGYAINGAGTSYSGDRVFVTSATPSTGALTASNCTIATGGSSCTTDLSWSTTGPGTAVAKVLVVGGGGGGGGAMGGGGGAGGLNYVATFPLAVQSYAVTVGTGGTGGSGMSTKGGTGGTSSFDVLTVLGGGGGSYYTGSANPGNDGASGGGGAHIGAGGSGTDGQGYAGGAGNSSYPAGGGGGSGAAGQAGQTTVAGYGGVGTSSSISGSAVYYAGGGGGGGYYGTTCTGGAGGNGGGGGGTCVNNANGTAGTANKGGGGGGGGYQNGVGGAGGSGVVIVSYPTANATCTGGTVTTAGSDTIHTFTSAGTFTCSSVAITSTVTTPTNITVATADSGTTTYAVPYSSRVFSLYNYTTLITQATATSACTSGSIWSGSICDGSPVVATPTATSIDVGSATLGANVTSLGDPASISARGTCWGTTASPTTNCTAEGGTTTGVFTHSRIGMSAGTTYYYRGYATNASGTGYSANGTFTTSFPPVVPTVTTPTATSIATTSATLGANVTSLGIPAAISARGTCWGTTANPTTNCAAQGSTTTGVFTHSRTGLPAGTLYYYRGYATNATGTGYSADGTFTTLMPPTVTTPTVTSIDTTSATLGANVTSLGNPATISARGTCWGTSAEPTTNCAAEGGTTTGVFTHSRTGLTPGTTYYYRGYATNAAGTGYSEDGTFSAVVLPTVTTSTVTSIAGTSATLGANVTSAGVPAVLSARGTCWGTTPSPRTNCAAEGDTATGVFTHVRTGLTVATAYYYCGYATNAVGTAYSPDGTFTTLNANAGYCPTSWTESF